MKDHIEFLDFHLFDGEGGGEGAGTASISGSEQDSKPQVVYGKSEGEGQRNGQVGSDNGNGADDINAEWEALTGKGGKFHDLLGQRVSGAIQERFKNQADLQGQVNQISEDLSPLFMNYGLRSGDFEGLKNAIANDEAFFKAGAERAGLDISQYKENLRLQAEAERGRKISEAYEQQMRQNQMFAQWESDASDLQQAFPNFDLNMEMNSNEAFRDLLNNGVDVKTAFISTHFDDIMNGASAYQQRTATQSVLNQISRRASRPPEGALNHSPAIERRSDPSALTNDDLDRINEIVANGGTVSF